MTDYDRVVLVKNEVFVYRIGPRASNRGYRAADWQLEKPEWTGRLRVVARGEKLFIKLEDRNSGDLFAMCPVDVHPGAAVEPVLDSSRYFVIRLQDEAGRNAFVGLGFGDRSDSFDLNVSLQEHFKQLRQEADAERSTRELADGPKLDLGFKEGQTIRIQLNTKKTGGEGATSTSSKKPASSGSGVQPLLPPPPAAGSTVIRLAPPPSASSTSNPFGNNFSAPAASSSSSSSSASASATANSMSLLDF